MMVVRLAIDTTFALLATTVVGFTSFGAIGCRRERAPIVRDDTGARDAEGAACTDTTPDVAQAVRVRFKLSGIERPGLFVTGADGAALPRENNVIGRAELTFENTSDHPVCVMHLGSLSLWLSHHGSPPQAPFRDHRTCLANRGTAPVMTIALAPHASRTLRAKVDLLTEQSHPGPPLSTYEILFRAVRTTNNAALVREGGSWFYKNCVEAMESPARDLPGLWVGAIDLGRSTVVLEPSNDAGNAAIDWQ